MKGRDLIIYILSNHLEDEEVFKDGKFIGFMTDIEVAAKLDMGVASVHTLVKLGVLQGVKLGETLYIFANFDHGGEDEREKDN